MQEVLKRTKKEMEAEMSNEAKELIDYINKKAKVKRIKVKQGGTRILYSNKFMLYQLVKGGSLKSGKA